jgi:hypothetical protein
MTVSAFESPLRTVIIVRSFGPPASTAGAWFLGDSGEPAGGG